MPSLYLIYIQYNYIIKTENVNKILTDLVLIIKKEPIRRSGSAYVITVKRSIAPVQTAQAEPLEPRYCCIYINWTFLFLPFFFPFSLRVYYSIYLGILLWFSHENGNNSYFYKYLLSQRKSHRVGGFWLCIKIRHCRWRH